MYTVGGEKDEVCCWALALGRRGGLIRSAEASTCNESDVCQLKWEMVSFRHTIYRP